MDFSILHIFSHTLKYRNVTVKTVRWRFGTLFFSSKIDELAIFSKVRGFLWAKYINPMSQDGYKKNGINGEFETFFDPAKLFRRLVCKMIFNTSKVWPLTLGSSSTFWKNVPFSGGL